MEKKTKKKSKAVQIKPTDALSEPMALGKVFVESGMFKDTKSQAQAVVKILAGRELGLAPLESMTNIYIVNGKVALQAKIIGSLIKKSSKYDYKIETLTNEECEITFYSVNGESKEELGKSKFTMKDATKALLVNKEVWKSYPRNLLFARALSNGSKWYCSDVFCGYTAEELDNPEKATSTVVLKEGEIVEDGEKTV